MNQQTATFADLDRAKGIAPLPPKREEEMPLPAWYRSIYETPLAKFSVEDLSKACRQQLHLEQIIPLVIARLQNEPLAGEIFDGELLSSLRSVGADFWKTHSIESTHVKSLIQTVRDDLPRDVRTDADEILRSIG